MQSLTKTVREHNQALMDNVDFFTRRVSCMTIDIELACTSFKGLSCKNCPLYDHLTVAKGGY